jgi:AcrR family transcriptional regulator
MRAADVMTPDPVCIAPDASITDAERAGVERPTLYRHFPTSKDLFSACSSHHWSQNPPPNPEPWLKIADPEARLRQGLTELYEYYSRHEHGMWKILRDLEDMPELRPFAAHRIAHRERVRQVLVGAWPDRDQRRKLSPLHSGTPPIFLRGDRPAVSDCRTKRQWR